MAYLWTCTVADSILVALIVSTIIYLAVNHFKRRDEKNSGMSIPIIVVVQLGLLFMTTVLFIIKDIWSLEDGVLDLEKETTD